LLTSSKFEIKITTDKPPVVAALRKALDGAVDDSGVLKEEAQKEVGGSVMLCDVAVKRLAVTVYPSYANTPNFNPCAMGGLLAPSVLIGSDNSIAPLQVSTEAFDMAFNCSTRTHAD
jgi:hypothetical protein